MSKIVCNVEITTWCNARCPQCSRVQARRQMMKEEIGTLELSDLATNEHMPFERFQKWFPEDELKYFKTVHFSGHVGDPGMHPELHKFVEYLTANGVRASVNTNLSMRDELYWWKLGMIGGELLTIIADVDGTTQEMHAKYRRRTKLDKVLTNMLALADTLAELKTFTVVFKHNEDYVDDIIALCKEHGATSHDVMTSSRFDLSPVFEFINEDGEIEILEQATSAVVSDNRNGKERLDFSLAEDSARVKGR